MTAGVFEASLTSDAEVARQRRQAADRLAAAVYDVRERFGPWLFAKSVEEYHNRLAMAAAE